MNRDYWRSSILLALAAGLLLGACGGGGSSAGSQSPAAGKPGAASGAPAPPAAPPAAEQQGAAPAALQPTREPVKLTVPYSPISGSTVPFWIALDDGLFERQGFEIDAQFVGGSSTIIQAMASGQYPIGLIGGGDAVLNRLHGGDLLLIGAHTTAFTINGYAKPEIRSIADLKGKTLVVTRIGTSTYFAAVSMLDSVGLKPEDVAFIQSGGVGESLAVLMSGQVDAAMIGYPAGLRAEQAGFPRLASLAKLGDYGVFPTAVTGTREGWLKEPGNRDIALRFLRAFHEGLQVARTDDAAAKRVLRKYTQTDDEAILQGTVDYYREYFPETLHVNERAIVNTLRLLDHPEARGADPKLFYDNSLADSIDRVRASR